MDSFGRQDKIGQIDIGQYSYAVRRSSRQDVESLHRHRMIERMLRSLDELFARKMVYKSSCDWVLSKVE